jgi:hypothetical protein
MRSALNLQDVPSAVFRAMVVAVIALSLFVALPWALMACRALGMSGWVYGTTGPMVGWIRMWALAPVWLLLVAVVALVLAVVFSFAGSATTRCASSDQA